jgi:hypothetical protein
MTVSAGVLVFTAALLDKLPTPPEGNKNDKE